MCLGPAVDSGVRSPRERPRSSGAKARPVWDLGYLEMNDFSAVMTKHDQGIEKPKRRGCNNEHVDGGNVMHVVVQK